METKRDGRRNTVAVDFERRLQKSLRTTRRGVINATDGAGFLVADMIKGESARPASRRVRWGGLANANSPNVKSHSWTATATARWIDS